jgi:hypothetical protein
VNRNPEASLICTVRSLALPPARTKASSTCVYRAESFASMNAPFIRAP